MKGSRWRWLEFCIKLYIHTYVLYNINSNNNNSNNNLYVRTYVIVEYKPVAGLSVCPLVKLPIQRIETNL